MCPLLGSRNLIHAVQKGNTKLDMPDLGDQAADSSFLNEIQKGLNEWKKRIMSITKLDWDVSSGTTMDEIGFWSKMEARLADIEAQLKNPLVGKACRLREE